MTRRDRAALKLTIEAARREPGRAEQLDAKLRGGETWESVAQFAATCVQGRKLGLKPWQLCPCDVDLSDVAHAPAHHQAAAAFELQRQMLRLKISKYHPDPVAAIAEAERATARR